MVKGSASRLPPNKLSVVGGDYRHYSLEAANDALVEFLNGEYPRASANLEVRFAPSEKDKRCGFTLLHDAAFPSEGANAPVFDDEGADLGAGGRRGNGMRIRRRKDVTANVSAQNASSGDPSKKTGGKTSGGRSGGGQQNKQKRSPTPGMAPGGNSTGG